MKALIENTITLILAVAIMTVAIISIENADLHKGYGDKTNEEKWALQQRYLDFIERKN